MPIYEYKCQQCGLHVEKRQSVSDAPLTACEKCHGKLEKQWSLSGFQFKGEGWYVTDYAGKKGKMEKSSNYESTPKPDSASKPASETSSTVKETVSKPDKA
ncbi:MAG TPA: zinc ribbon domain-containing protein [Pyrinomonadaceae bacterium]|nr:zinc ribbon domain-containing protein [Pyrinomonadaceae bacterium]